MLRTLNALWNDRNGFVVSAELVLVLTIGVLAMIVGLHGVAKSITQEFNDLASAFGALDQSYCFAGLQKAHHARVVGSAYSDREDDCDCTVIIQPPPAVKVDQSSGTAEAGWSGW